MIELNSQAGIRNRMPLERTLRLYIDSKRLIDDSNETLQVT